MLPLQSGDRLRLAVVVQQLAVALLLLSRPALQADGQLALDQPLQGRVNAVELGETKHALGPLLELARRLGSA